VDYKAVSDLGAAVREAAKPLGGIDAYFENVGGDHLRPRSIAMKAHGRMAVCGMIARYNDDEPLAGAEQSHSDRRQEADLARLHRVRSFRCLFDFVQDLSSWMMAGKVKTRDTVFEGIEKTPDAFMGLFTGANIGKMLVKL
jgi:NADPH-dependent curcumin reductase CurA